MEAPTGLEPRRDLEGEERVAHQPPNPPEERFHEPLREYRAPRMTPVPTAMTTGTVAKLVGRGFDVTDPLGLPLE